MIKTHWRRIGGGAQRGVDVSTQPKFRQAEFEVFSFEAYQQNTLWKEKIILRLAKKYNSKYNEQHLVCFCFVYLLGYDAILLEVLGSKLIVTGQAAYFDFWVLGFDEFGAEAQQNSCHALTSFLRRDTESFHQHCLAIVNHTHRLQRNLPNTTDKMEEDAKKQNTD